MSMSSSRSPMSGANFPPNCKPHLGPSASQIQTLVMTGLAFSRSSDELERSSNKVIITSYVCYSKAPCPMDVNS